MLPAAPKYYRRGILAAAWLTLTLSLSAWWMVFGLRQTHQLQSVEGSEVLTRYQHMLLWEGSFLLLVVLAGGIALLYYSYLDLRRHEQLKSFFSSFTHDLKTSLASLRLQAEIIEENQVSSSPNLARLLQDVVRLELQLDNSLFLANADSGKLLKENLDMKRVMDRLSHYWPDLNLKLETNVKVIADQRALESVLKNLIQNALIHGAAKKVIVRAAKASAHKVKISIIDDGKGFAGDIELLGKPYLRPEAKSGSGLGIYLAKDLLKRMGGELHFVRNDTQGLSAILSLQGELC